MITKQQGVIKYDILRLPAKHVDNIHTWTVPPNRTEDPDPRR